MVSRKISTTEQGADVARHLGDAPWLHLRNNGVTFVALPDVTLDYAGSVPYDEFMRRAAQRQAAVADLYPGCIASQGFKNLAARADTWLVPDGARGHLEFFVERLVMAGTGVGALQ